MTLIKGEYSVAIELLGAHFCSFNYISKTMFKVAAIIVAKT